MRGPWQATVVETAVHLVSRRAAVAWPLAGAEGVVTPTSNDLSGWRHVPRDTDRALWCFRQSSAKEGLTVEPHTSDSGPGSVTHSHDDRRDAAHEPNDTSRAGGGLDLREGELKAAVSVATAQLSQDLHAVGSQVLSIETGHRALMDRLHRIAEQADERALRQFGALQEQVEDTRRQILSAREDLEVVRGSFLDADKRTLHQFGSLQAQVEDARRQILSAREDLEVVRGSFLDADERALRQFGSLQEQVEDAQCTETKSERVGGP